MSAFTSSTDMSNIGFEESAAGLDIGQNLLTTAGAVIGGGTVLSATALVTSVLPAQMLAAAAAAGACLYAGDRQAKDLPIVPFVALGVTTPDTQATSA